jgi:hypothetical protein
VRYAKTVVVVLALCAAGAGGGLADGAAVADSPGHDLPHGANSQPTFFDGYRGHPRAETNKILPGPTRRPPFRPQ